MKLPLPGKASAILALFALGLGAPVSAQTSAWEPPEDFDGIYCANFHPGATFEELLEYCAEDVPPYNGAPGGGGGDFPNGPLWPAGPCSDRASIICNFEQP